MPEAQDSLLFTETQWALSLYSFHRWAKLRLVYMPAQFLQSCPTLRGLWTAAYQAPLSRGFSRQEYWSGLPCPPPRDLPDPGIESISPVSPTLQQVLYPLSHVGSPRYVWKVRIKGPEDWPASPNTRPHILFSEVFVSLSLCRICCVLEVFG